MNSVDWDTIRLFLHVLAATIWVGGQLTLAALLSVLRSLGKDAPKMAARKFNTVAWPAFAVLIVTGIWNITSVGFSNETAAWRHTLEIKLVIVALSGLAAYLHTRSRSKAGLAIWGALTGLTALAALFFGILLTT